MRALAFFLFLPIAAHAQSADCVARPAVPGNQMSLDFSIPLARQPGVPASARGGYAGFGMQDVPANGTVCGTEPPVPPRDVLRGQPSGDLLMGTPPHGRVTIEVK